MNEHLRAAQELLDEIQRTKAAIDCYYDAYLENDCPIKIGDVVEIQGYTHKGKKMRIERLEVVHFGKGFRVRLVGAVLRKDGTEGLNMADFYVEAE